MVNIEHGDWGLRKQLSSQQFLILNHLAAQKLNLITPSLSQRHLICHCIARYQDLFSTADATHNRKDVVHDKGVRLCTDARHSVFGEDKFIASVEGCSCG